MPDPGEPSELQPNELLQVIADFFDLRRSIMDSALRCHPLPGFRTRATGFPRLAPWANRSRPYRGDPDVAGLAHCFNRSRPRPRPLEELVEATA